jgi:hypothetical protein
MSVAETLLKPPMREQIIRESREVLDAEVADKRGVSGLAVKGTFKVVKGIKPGLIPNVIDGLLDDFMGKIEPFWNSWKEDPKGKTCRQHFIDNGPAVAEALLDITDARARKNKSKVLVKSYQKLRPKGREHVIAAMPRVGAMIEKHTKDL